MGTLANLPYPQGLCADTAGNVFVTTVATNKSFAGSSYIYEFRHGGSQPIAKLDEGSYYPRGCSVDPTTGNLAVANVQALNGNGGNIEIFRKARGSPQAFSDGSGSFFFCAYDDEGDLYVDHSPNLGYDFSELPRGGVSNGRFVAIPLNRKIVDYGSIQWNAGLIAISDDSNDEIYDFRIVKNQGVEVRSIQLEGASRLGQFWIQQNEILRTSPDVAKLLFWKYPGGGSPTATIGGFDYPYGVAVSLHS